MLFGDGIGYSALFATHPPLVDRIKRIEPRFDPSEIGEIARRWGPAQPLATATGGGDGFDEGAEVSLSGFAPLGAGAPRAPAAREKELRPPAKGSASVAVGPSRGGARVDARPDAVRSQIGTGDDGAVRRAQGLGAAIPESLRTAAYLQDRAPVLVLALSLDADPGVRERQLELIGSQYAPEARVVAASLYGELESLDPMLRLPLAGLAFPALRRQPR